MDVRTPKKYSTRLPTVHVGVGCLGLTADCARRHIPPIQLSVALESYFEEVKFQLAEIQMTNNLPNTKRKALKTLQEDPNINLKADKATQMVVLNTENKIREGQIQLDSLEQYKPLEQPTVVETSPRVQQLVK